jgi:hypothetical protein
MYTKVLTSAEYDDYMNFLAVEIRELSRTIQELYISIETNKGCLTNVEIKDLIIHFKAKQNKDFDKFCVLNQRPENMENGYDRIFSNTKLAELKKYLKC